MAVKFTNNRVYTLHLVLIVIILDIVKSQILSTTKHEATL